MPEGYNDVYTKDVEARIKAIESALDQIWHMLQNTISKEQFNRMNIINQSTLTRIDSRITSLTTDVTDLESRVDALQ